jgi:hypothetical protein
MVLSGVWWLINKTVFNTKYKINPEQPERPGRQGIKGREMET